jgi:predicted negative regulator of RcsB-dependent stress response
MSCNRVRHHLRIHTPGILFKQKNYAEASDWIEKALVSDKDNSAVQEEHYGDIMFYLGDTNAAVENWKKG